jgi:DnaJ-class molecular chaperone
MAVHIKIDSKTIKEAINFVRLIYSIGNSVSQGVGTIQVVSNPYEVLGISPRATNEELKQRYRQLAKVWHPDQQGGDEEAMKRLNAAYKEICDQRQIKA